MGVQAIHLEKEKLSCSRRYSGIRHRGIEVREQLLLWHRKHAELSWEGDRLKSSLGPGLNSSLIFKGILVPNKQLVGLPASLGLQMPWPEEASMPVLLLNCPCAPQSDCHLDKRMLGINFHYVFMDANDLIILKIKKKKNHREGSNDIIAKMSVIKI